MEQLCPNCRKVNVAHALFCANCGTRLTKPAAGIPAPQMQKTQFTGGSGSQEKNELIIGRAPDCDIVLHEDSVSSRHARIFLRNGNLILEDTGSMNGVFVNGKKIYEGAILSPHDNVTLGYAVLNLSHPLIITLFSQAGTTKGSFSRPAGDLKNFSFNKNFIGKILFAIMIALIFLPWLRVDLGESYSSWLFKDTKLTVSAFQFAFNIPVNSDKSAKVNYDKDMPFPARTLCLSLLIILIIGFGMNFINLKISRQFNAVNIVSVVVFSITLAYIFLFKNNSDKSFVDIAVLGFGVYIFTLICFVSIFEGLIEYFINKLFKKY